MAARAPGSCYFIGALIRMALDLTVVKDDPEASYYRATHLVECLRNALPEAAGKRADAAAQMRQGASATELSRRLGVSVARISDLTRRRRA